MMQISNVNAAGNGNTIQAAKNPVSTQIDSVSKDIQSKIMNAKKQQQDLSSNKEMTAEEKENQRQKIQQEISDLKRELRQYQAEQKKKQQEADKAAETKKEQKERASKEAVRDQQRKEQLTEDVNGRQERVSQLDGSRQSYGAEVEQDSKEIQPSDGMHKIIFTDSSIEQFRVVSNVTAQMDGKARIQESEIAQDAARGVDVENAKKEHRAELQKETKRMQTMQTFMFRRKSPSEDAFAGMDSQFSNSVMKKGLYSHSGTMSGNHFPPVQMDLRQ